VKIKVVGKRELVTSVEVSMDHVANQLHLLITTRDRWAPHQMSGGWGIFSSLVPKNEAPLAHRLVAVGAAGQDEDVPGAEVVFLPENDAERALLHGIAYDGSEKDQIAYIIVPLALESVRRLSPLARITV
jgi:hypothetical protein